MLKFMHTVGAALGNWNDRANGGDSISTRRRPRIWRGLDHVAGWLNTR